MRLPRPTPLHLLLVAGPGLFMLGAVARHWPAEAKPLCLMHKLTGLPCPGCGSFRALCLFTAGRWLESWWMQPLMTLLFTAVVLLSTAAWIARMARRPLPPLRPLTRREHALLTAGAACAVFLNWVYLLASRR